MPLAIAAPPVRQFILYSSDKKPRSPFTGQVCNPHDPQMWTDYQTAAAAVAAGLGKGVGLVFTATDPYIFIDLDHALQSDNTWSDTAVKVCAAFAGAYIEVSSSGTGLHIICSGTLPPGHGTRNGKYQVEMYDALRYCALTGSHAAGSMSHPAQPQLDWLLSFPGWSPPPTAGGPAANWTTGPCPEWSGPEDDGELINRMLLSRPSAASALGNRATLPELWAADVDALSRCYPDPRGYDCSSADAALCSHLAFWTGRDCERMDRLFHMSGLVREKWERTDYRQTTILKAVGLCHNVLGDRQPAPAQPAATITSTSGICSVSEQQAYFKGCVYIRDQHRVWVPDGALLKPEQFKVDYGGRSFFLDAHGNKTSKDAWECFTQSQAISFPKAHSCCFRPELPAGAIETREGRTIVNIYVPVSTKRIAGDPGKFIELLAKLLPDGRDREILVTYLASMLQNPGEKFQWWPVIQGVQGNGKSAIISVMEQAIGERYTFLPNPESMAKTGNQFNGWMQGKLFMGIEEIYVNGRRDFLEAFKSTITGSRLSMEGKGIDQLMGDNRCNGIMNTNHKDGVPIDDKERRYVTLFTAQQAARDLERDGMTGNYFPDLYDWLKGRRAYAKLGAGYGFAVVNDWLGGYAVAAEFDPAGLCQRAPMTTSTPEAIELSRGTIEQEILEAIATERPGFRGGWVSSCAVDRLLKEHRLEGRLPRNRRRAMLQSLGYDWHPGLKNGGRVWNPFLDCGIMDKPVLYCKPGGLVSQLTGAARIVELYIKAQAEGGGAAWPVGETTCG